jgi:hypothetical protein
MASISQRQLSNSSKLFGLLFGFGHKAYFFIKKKKKKNLHDPLLPQ